MRWPSKLKLATEYVYADYGAVPHSLLFKVLKKVCMMWCIININIHIYIMIFHGS